jgi:hypothetical protein
MTLGAIPRGPGFNSRSAHSFSALVAIISYSAPIYAFAALSSPSLSTWHQLFGHLSQQAICWLASSRLVGGLELESGGREHL